MDPDKFNNKTGKVILASGRGYYVFKPNPLPLKVLYDQRLIKYLSSALSNLGNLSGMGQNLENPHLLITPYLKKEAVLSSKIEGTRTTLSDVNNKRV